MSLIQLETQAGEPVIAGETKLTPFRRAMHLHLPGLPRRLLRDRLLVVLVQTPDGAEMLVPAPDVADEIRPMLFIAGLMGLFVLWLLWRRSRSPDLHARGKRR